MTYFLEKARVLFFRTASVVLFDEILTNLTTMVRAGDWGIPCLHIWEVAHFLSFLSFADLFVVPREGGQMSLQLRFIYHNLEGPALKSKIFGSVTRFESILIKI